MLFIKHVIVRLDASVSLFCGCDCYSYVGVLGDFGTGHGKWLFSLWCWLVLCCLSPRVSWVGSGGIASVPKNFPSYHISL